MKLPGLSYTLCALIRTAAFPGGNGNPERWLPGWPPPRRSEHLENVLSLLPQPVENWSCHTARHLPRLGNE